MRRVTRPLAVLVGLLMICVASPANAASGTWSSSGKTGVHSQGSWSTAYSKLYFSGYVKDTACDAHAVKIEIRFYEKQLAPFYGLYRVEKVTNSGGCGTSKSFSYNTALGGRTVRVMVQECIVDGGVGKVDSCAGGWVTGDIQL